MSTEQKMTPAQAKPHAMQLLINLGDAIGDKAAITDVLERTVTEHPDDWPLVVLSAIGWCFAEHTRLDPDHLTEPTGVPA